MRELIDVLDLSGCRTGQTCLRSDAHKLGYWHATVHIFVYRFRENELQLLVHLRSQSKDLYPDTFDPVFGGHVQAGSEPIATACEELSGEIGITVVASQLQQGPVLMADKGLDKEFNHLFAYHYQDTDSLVFLDGEVSAISWMSVAKINESFLRAPSRWRPSLDEFTAESEFFAQFQR